MEKETTYSRLFHHFAKPGEKFDEAWVEAFEERIITEGDVVAAHYWDSGSPGAGAGVISIYFFEDLFFSFDGEEFDGPYESLSQAAEASNLLKVTAATERIWMDYKPNSDSEGR